MIQRLIRVVRVSAMALAGIGFMVSASAVASGSNNTHPSGQQTASKSASSHGSSVASVFRPIHSAKRET